MERVTMPRNHIYIVRNSSCIRSVNPPHRSIVKVEHKKLYPKDDIFMGISSKTIVPDGWYVQDEIIGYFNQMVESGDADWIDNLSPIDIESMDY